MPECSSCNQRSRLAMYGCRSLLRNLDGWVDAAGLVATGVSKLTQLAVA